MSHQIWLAQPGRFSPAARLHVTELPASHQFQFLKPASCSFDFFNRSFTTRCLRLFHTRERTSWWAGERRWDGALSCTRCENGTLGHSGKHKRVRVLEMHPCTHELTREEYGGPERQGRTTAAESGMFAGITPTCCSTENDLSSLF